MANEGLKPLLVLPKIELNSPATECNKAFLAAEFEHSSHPQVQRADNLCSAYVRIAS